jgi:iron(II)-dependent oxidoreductase
MRSADLVAMLTDARRRTLALVADLTDEQMRVPRMDIVNPLVWELGHVAWFQEKWALRHLRELDPILPDADSFWDSAAVAHDARWELPLPSRGETLHYLQQVLDCVLEKLDHDDASQDEAYFHWLAAMHEDMHGEALAYTRQTLGYPAPRFAEETLEALGLVEDVCDEDVFVTGGRYDLGAEPGSLFVFDNEKWAHPHELPPFAIARTPVTNAQFAAFVDDGGYHREESWSEEGWQWRQQAQASAPVYWTPQDGRWMERHFDQTIPLAPDLPVIHVNWHEADAYCRWARRRLPTEAEWELAATGLERKRRFPWGGEAPTCERAHLDAQSTACIPVGALPASDSVFGCRQMIGNVWEWTAADFLPYPGFTVDPYKEYSEPWFGSQRKVLRGGCWATRSRLIRNTWRNYFTKERRDIFAGFRTCALQGFQATNERESTRMKSIH